MPHSLFCGKARLVASVHRTLAKSRLSSPSADIKNNRYPFGYLLFLSLVSEKELVENRGLSQIFLIDCLYGIIAQTILKIIYIHNKANNTIISSPKISDTYL